MIVIEIIKQISSLSDEAAKELESRIESSFVPKGTLLLHKGSICKHIYFLHFGFAQQFKIVKGTKISNYFWFSNDFVTHMISFLTQEPTDENIEVLRDSKIYSLSYEDLQFMYDHFPEFNHFGRIMLEKYFLDIARLGALSKIKPAKMRYELLEAQRPELFQEASLGQIATYLNISIETLSRIRAELTQSKGI